jgi:hypothetical protein
MIGKIIGTSLAGILQFYMGFNWSFFIVCRICVFELTWGQQREFPELMEQAQQEFAGTAKCISRNYGIYQ